MDAFSLLAKLMLKTQEFDESLANAQEAADNFEGPKVKIEVDTSDVVDEDGNPAGDLADAKKAIDEFKGPEADIEIDASDATDEDGPLAQAQAAVQDFVDKVGEAEEETNGFGESAGEIFKGIASNLAAAGVTALINGFIQSVANLMDLAKNLGKDISENAKEVGISTTEFQRWDRAMKLSGSSANDLAGGVENIKTWLHNLNEEEKPENFEDLAAAFAELGVEATDADGKLRSTESVLKDVIFALAGMEEGEKKANLTEKLLGGGKELTKFLETTAADMNDLRMSAPILSEEQIQSSIRYNDTLERMNASLEDLKTTVSIGLLGPLQNVVDGLTAVMKFFTPDNWRDKSAEGMMNRIDQGAAAATLNLEGTAAQAETLIQKMIDLGPASQQTAEQHQQWVKYADWLITNIPTLSEYIDIEKGSLTGEADALKENVRQWKERQKALIIQQALEDRRAVVAQKLAEAIDAQTDLTMKEAEAEGARAKAIAFLNNLLVEDANFREVFDDNYNGDAVTDKQGFKFVGQNATLEELSSLNDLLSEVSPEAYGQYYSLIEDAGDKVNAVATAQETLTNKTNDYNSAVEIFNQSADSAQQVVNKLGQEIQNLPDSKTIDIYVNEHRGDPGSNIPMYQAAGNWSVPYDDYLTRLHRGELVMTASQARHYRDGDSGASFDMNGLVSGIIAAVQAGMADATVDSYMDGKRVSGGVSRRTMNQLKARRFTGA